MRGTGLVYDILVFQRQLANAIRFVDGQADDQQFVLDHVGKPMPGREGEWAELVREMAKRENVACKFSGVVTEVGTGFDSVRRVFDTVLEAFGPNRLMWGSDWPVVTAKMAYREWKSAVDGLVAPLSESERQAILGATAARDYGISP
jgi:L-fuconolactonase